MSSTHVDLHGDQVTKEALEALAAQVGQTYIPVAWQHDLRYPPLGRVVGARLVELPDGEVAVEGDQEFWDAEDDSQTAAGDGRRVPVQINDAPGLTVGFDRTFDGEALNDLREIARVIGTSDLSFMSRRLLSPYLPWSSREERSPSGRSRVGSSRRLDRTFTTNSNAG